MQNLLSSKKENGIRWLKYKTPQIVSTYFSYFFTHFSMKINKNNLIMQEKFLHFQKCIPTSMLKFLPSEVSWRLGFIQRSNFNKSKKKWKKEKTRTAAHRKKLNDVSWRDIFYDCFFFGDNKLYTSTEQKRLLKTPRES